jgi:hypothetical protein
VKPAKVTMKVTKNLGTDTVANISALSDDAIIAKFKQNLTVSGFTGDLSSIASITVKAPSTIKRGSNTFKVTVTLTDGNYSFGSKNSKTFSVTMKGT